MGADAAVFVAAFLAAVFVFADPLPVAVVDEAAPEDLDAAVEVFLVVLVVPVFLVAVDFALVVIDFALAAADLDLAAALVALGAAVGCPMDGDAEAFGISLVTAAADFTTGDLAGAGFCGDASTAFGFEVDGLEEDLDMALSGDGVESCFSASSNPSFMIDRS